CSAPGFRHIAAAIGTLYAWRSRQRINDGETPMRITGRAMVVGLALVVFVLGLGTTADRARASGDAGAFVQQLGNQAIETLTGGDVTPDERRERFRTLLDANFDVPAIGKTVLGRYWKVATPEEQQEYLGLFETFLVKNYAKRFAEY